MGIGIQRWENGFGSRNRDSKVEKVFGIRDRYLDMGK